MSNLYDPLANLRQRMVQAVRAPNGRIPGSMQQVTVGGHETSIPAMFDPETRVCLPVPIERK